MSTVVSIGVTRKPRRRPTKAMLQRPVAQIIPFLPKRVRDELTGLEQADRKPAYGISDERLYELAVQMAALMNPHSSPGGRA